MLPPSGSSVFPYTTLFRSVHFQIVEFLSSFGWLNSNAHARWQAEYTNAEYSNSIIIHSSSGEGDLVADLSSGQRLRVESKKRSEEHTSELQSRENLECRLL